VARVEVLERFFLGKALFRIGEAEVRAGELHEVFGVALVHDGEVGGETGGGPEAAQEAVGGGVEGATVDFAARAPDEAGPRACDDKERSVAEGGSGSLLGIE
jgi:hypothetical protein